MIRTVLIAAIITLALVGPAAAGVTAWQSAVATEYDGLPDDANPGYAGGWQTNWGFAPDVFFPVALRYNQWNDPNPLVILTAIEWELTGECWGTVMLENTSNNPNTITYFLQAKVTLSKPGGGVISQVIPLASGARVKPAFDGALNFAGTSGESFPAPEAPPIPATFSDTGLLTAPADLFAFSGLGTVDMPVTAAGLSTYSDTQGNAAVSFETRAQGKGRLRYHYDDRAIPEPGTASLFLAGLAGLGIVRRRRNKTA